MSTEESKVYADFQKVDDDGRLILSCYGTKKDLAAQGISLQEGLTLTFYMDDADNDGNLDDLIVRGEVQYNEALKEWVAKINWADIRHASEL